MIPKLEAEDIEVQIMDDISCVISDEEGDEEQNGGSGNQVLLIRFQLLEQQVAACVESLPLLYQVFNKCNALEQRLKARKKDVDQCLSAFSKGKGVAGSPRTRRLAAPAPGFF